MLNLFLSDDKQMLHLQCDFHVRELAKRIGGHWNQSYKSWDFAFDLNNLQSIRNQFPELTLSPALIYEISVKKQQQEQFIQYKREAKDNKDIDIDINDIKLPLYNYQKHGIRSGSIIDGGFLIADEMGLGKECVNGTPVLTEFGWKPIESLIVGEKIYGQDGKLHNIIGIFPQGVKDIYRIKFSDGVIADVGLEHLWAIRSLNDRRRGKGWRVENTAFIKNNIKYRNMASIWEIPVVNPIEYPAQKQDIPAYVIGTLIADGSLTDGLIFVPGDMEVPAIIKTMLPEDYKLNVGADYGTSTAYRISYKPIKNKNPWMEYIRFLKLNVTSEQKFIPVNYLMGSIDQRKNLLAGLLDNDGTVKNSRTRYSTSSYKLANDIVSLVQSLGGLAVISPTLGRRRIRNGKLSIEMDSYNISIRVSFNPFKKKSNVAKWKISNKLIRQIYSIEYLKKEYATCIATSAPNKLYIINDYIVTHNSIQSIAIVIAKKKADLINNCLIICPASLKYNWLNEIKKFTDEKALVIDGDSSERFYKWLVGGYFFKIVNYDIIVRDLFYDKKEKKIEDGTIVVNKDNRIHDYEKVLSLYGSILVDEIHYIKTHSAQRTRALKLFKTKYRAGLTGTPLDGRLEELHSIFEFLKPGLFSSKHKFLQRHAVYDYFGGIKGYIKTDEVKEKIEPYYIRRLKKDVLTELPDKTYKDIYVELPSKSLDEYKKLAKRKHEITEESEAIVAVIRCRQFCDFPEIIDLDFDSAKFSALEELLQEVVKDNKQKMIIFTQYKKSLDILHSRLKTSYNILTLDSSVSDSKKRIDICDKFNNDNDSELIIMTDAGSVGLNLATASYVTHYDDNYSAAVMNQRADRAHRIGQKSNVTVIRFITKDTVEERVREVIDTKIKLNSQILDEECTEYSIGTMSATDLVKLL